MRHQRMLGIHIRAQWLMRTLFTFLYRIRHHTASFTFFTRITCWIAGAFVQGRCQRTDPPCKYLHPPQHLKEQLLQNGRNNLIMRNLNQLQRIQPLPPTAALYSFVRMHVAAVVFTVRLRRIFNAARYIWMYRTTASQLPVCNFNFRRNSFIIRSLCRVAR